MVQGTVARVDVSERLACSARGGGEGAGDGGGGGEGEGGDGSVDGSVEGGGGDGGGGCGGGGVVTSFDGGGLTCSACVRPSISLSLMLQPARLSSVHTLFDESAAPS